MRFDIDVAQHQLDWPELLSRARYAEEAGFEGAWVFDHFEPLYGDRGGPCLEAWTLLAALAAGTERIRLGALVTGVTYRHPSVLATEVVTVDRVSNGRLDLGIGAGWNEHEHRALGIPFPGFRERTERLDEALHVIRSLTTEDGATFQGRHYQLSAATFHPRPVQKPYPPIWIGTEGGPRMLPIVARHADVWHAYLAAGELRRKGRLLDQLAEEAGRDPARIARASNLSISEEWDEVRRSADELREAGVSYLVVSWPSEGKGRLEEFVEKILPDLAD